MKIIYKYTVPFSGMAVVSLPKQAPILHVGEQDGVIFIWALVDMSEITVPRYFRIYGTGFAFKDEVQHVGSVIVDDGRLVWHVFEVSA